MSRPAKELIQKEIAKRLDGVKDLAVVSVMGVDGKTNNALRRELRAKGIGLMIVNNAMASKAMGQLGLDGAVGLLEGPCAVAWGGESIVDVVREFLGRGKDVPTLTVKGAYMEGELFGPDRVVELSRYPTQSEALGNLARAATSPGANLAAALLAPGAVLAGILKSIEDAAGGDAADGE